MSTERKRLVKADEIAELLDTTRRMVHYYRKRCGMPAQKFGPRTYRFDREAVAAWSKAYAERSRSPLRPV